MCEAQVGLSLLQCQHVLHLSHMQFLSLTALCEKVTSSFSCGLLPLGTLLVPSKSAWWDNSKGLWIRDAMNRHEEGKRKSHKGILRALLAHTVHLHGDFLIPEHISLPMCASGYLAQLYGRPRHIISPSS